MADIPPIGGPKIPASPPPPPEGGGKPKKISEEGTPLKKGATDELYKLDAQAIAARLAAYSKEAGPSMAEIIAMAIRETGVLNPQAAMEEINKRIQKEIEDTLEEIKANKELMEEEEAWQDFAELLENKMTKEQIEGFLGLIGSAIKELGSHS